MNKWVIKKKNWKVVIKRQLEDGDKCPSSIGSTENMLNESTCWPVWNGLQWQTDKEGYYGISLSDSKVGCTHIQLLWSRWVEGQVNLEQQEQNRLAEYKLLWSSRHSVWSHVTAFSDTNASRKPGLPRSSYAIGSAKEKTQKAELWEVTTEAFLEKSCLILPHWQVRLLWSH